MSIYLSLNQPFVTQNSTPNPPLTNSGGVRLELTPTTNSPLAIDVAESTKMRIQRLILENPLIIFSKPSCCMCHVMKQLLSTVGVYPTVIELDDDEIGEAVEGGGGGGGGGPVVFIGGTRVGGLESLVALHLTNQLVPRLVEVGALNKA
ncbi:oxidoreductase [Lithospermum erythrorhizon]|uniref:Oxidoreductase n=1 Tax=Lithospermum erythrorhizon TaxID=34254 RepID=A0AAV3RN34_LITER